MTFLKEKYLNLKSLKTFFFNTTGKGNKDGHRSSKFYRREREKKVFRPLRKMATLHAKLRFPHSEFIILVMDLSRSLNLENSLFEAGSITHNSSLA